jgi:hypothetical protein
MTGPCWGYHRGGGLIHLFDENGQSVCKKPHKGGHYCLALPIPNFHPERHPERTCPICMKVYFPEEKELLSEGDVPCQS